MKTKIQLGAGIISLIALLSYTLIHTGGLLGHYISPPFVGYVAALGIEVAIVSLSLRIGDLRKSGLSVSWFLFVLISVVVVSALANVSEGFRTSEGEPLTFISVRQLDGLQAIIGLAATGLISLIVLALSEIIGSDVQSVAAAAERERKKLEKQTETNNAASSIEQARQIDLYNDAATKEHKLEQMIDIYRTRPDAKPREVYKALDMGRTTFYTYLGELKESGRLVENGMGYKVN